MTELKCDSVTEIDIVIIGAGISGIGAAYYVQRDCTDRSFTILEGRNDIGGTWDLHKYPGIRSDSDCYTFSYEFHPWSDEHSVASAQVIKDYLKEVVTEYKLDKKIEFGIKVAHADWSNEEQRWTLSVIDQSSGHERTIRCKFLIAGTGYYNYDKGYLPEFPGYDDFGGEIVHPQHWPEKLEYQNKRVVVIGSGATAVTLVPALAEKAAHVTMLQRTPTYMASAPDVDALANTIKRIFPSKLAHRINRKKNVYMSRAFVGFCRRFPKTAKRMLISGVKKQLPDGYDVEKHFTPPYKPWDQRLCLAVNGDLFEVIKDGRASVETNQIDRFVSNGIRLKSGEEIDADIIVTATGLDMQLMGGIKLSIDGKRFELSKALAYRGFMLGDLPNFFFMLGYTTSSWTLKIGLLGEYFCRVMNYMSEKELSVCYPPQPGEGFETRSVFDLESGYALRAAPKLPLQGTKAPWLMSMDYIPDVKLYRRTKVDDGTMRFLS